MSQARTRSPHQRRSSASRESCWRVAKREEDRRPYGVSVAGTVRSRHDVGDPVCVDDEPGASSLSLPGDGVRAEGQPRGRIEFGGGQVLRDRWTRRRRRGLLMRASTTCALRCAKTDVATPPSRTGSTATSTPGLPPAGCEGGWGVTAAGETAYTRVPPFGPFVEPVRADACPCQRAPVSPRDRNVLPSPCLRQSEASPNDS